MASRNYNYKLIPNGGDFLTFKGEVNYYTAFATNFS